MGITHMDWPGAVLHMEVSEVDSASLGCDNYTAETAEGLCQGKTRAHREGSRTVEEYTCGITQRGITTLAPSPAQGLTLGKHTSAGPGVWRSATPDCQGCGRNFNRVRRGELN